MLSPSDFHLQLRKNLITIARRGTSMSQSWFLSNFTQEQSTFCRNFGNVKNNKKYTDYKLGSIFVLNFKQFRFSPNWSYGGLWNSQVRIRRQNLSNAIFVSSGSDFRLELGSNSKTAACAPSQTVPFHFIHHTEGIILHTFGTKILWIVVHRFGFVQM